MKKKDIIAAALCSLSLLCVVSCEKEEKKTEPVNEAAPAEATPAANEEQAAAKPEESKTTPAETTEKEAAPTSETEHGAHEPTPPEGENKE